MSNQVDPEMLKNLELLMDFELLESGEDWETLEQADSAGETDEEEE